MNPDDITKLFAAFLLRKGIVLEQVTPPQAIDLMVEFHSSVQCDWAARHPHSDMLLFQYGVYDWGHGENFELNVTRQLMHVYAEDVGETVVYFQLELTLFYKPDTYREIPDFNRWSMDCQSIAEFVNEMKKTDGYLRACCDVPRKVEMNGGLV
jgi:hypothetical protein